MIKTISYKTDFFFKLLTQYPAERTKLNKAQKQKRGQLILGPVSPLPPPTPCFSFVPLKRTDDSWTDKSGPASPALSFLLQQAKPQLETPPPSGYPPWLSLPKWALPLRSRGTRFTSIPPVSDWEVCFLRFLWISWIQSWTKGMMRMMRWVGGSSVHKEVRNSGLGH